MHQSTASGRIPPSPRGNPCSWLQRALVLDVDGVDRGARRHEQPVPLLAAEAEVGARLRQVNLADQVAARRVAADPVLPRVGPPGQTHETYLLLLSDPSRMR